ERDRLELGVGEHAVERLLARVAGAAEDRGGDHALIMQISAYDATMKRLAHLVLEDGTAFPGLAVGAPGMAAGEACFTTASTGYEEAATDPSYVAQVLCFAYPLIGNYGVDPARAESGRVQAEAIVMRKARPGWAAWLAAQGV